MLSTTPLSSGTHRNYVRWDTSLDRLAAQADEMKTRGCEDSCELRAGNEGLSSGGDGPVLPLSLGEFRQAYQEIKQSQGWLTDRAEVSCYQDARQQTHLDVVNFGGFILAGGHVVDRSINAW